MSRPTNAAILFAPLRVLAVPGGMFEVCTRDDKAPGSLNNFALCRCQQKPEADLFAAAPELLAALHNAIAMLAAIQQMAGNGPINELCRDGLVPARHAVHKAEKGQP